MMPDPKTYKQHFENKHPKNPLPSELQGSGRVPFSGEPGLVPRKPNMGLEETSLPSHQFTLFFVPFLNFSTHVCKKS